MLTIDRSVTIARLRTQLRVDAAEAHDLRVRAASLLPAGHALSRKALRAARRSGKTPSPAEVTALRMQDRALRAAAAPSGPTRHALHARARDAGARARDLGLALAFLRGRSYRQVEPRTREVFCRAHGVAQALLGARAEASATRALAKDIDAWAAGATAPAYAQPVPETARTATLGACAP